MTEVRPGQPRGQRRALTGLLNAGQQGATPIPPSLQAKMAALANRGPPTSSGTPDAAADALQNLALSPGGRSAAMRGPASFPPHQLPTLSNPAKGGLAARRIKPNFSLKDIDKNAVPPVGGGASGAGLGAGRPVFDMPKRPQIGGTPFSNFSKIVDPSGALNFNGKAVLSANGVNFENGVSFDITMDQLQLDEELGRGNYGTVKKVLHKPTNVAMAMKEIRLELDQAKLNAILMELDILHRAVAPEIVEFYGAFFIESCVYYCMEFMDAGSLDKLCGVGVPEDVLAKIASSMVKGLKFLKDELQVIHRDVKPTNVLVNKKGQIKLCDFGVSGQLEKSLAKTNIGCQSYMAPERIKGESQNNIGTYTVSSDVWSLGLSMIEMAIGKYPYPPETYSNVFAQLTAIVHGDPPELPADKYSEVACSWVAKCLIKDADTRASYQELLEHPFLAGDADKEVDVAGWVESAVKYRAEHAADAAASSAPATLVPSGEPTSV